MIHSATTIPQALNMPASQIIAALERGTYTPEELWDIQVSAAAVALGDGVGSRWTFTEPLLGVSFNEDTVTAGEVRMVTERTGVTMMGLGYEGLLNDGRLLYEFVRAHMIISMGRDAADAEAMLDRIPQSALMNGLSMEAIAPDPKEPSGTMYPSANFGAPSPDSTTETAETPSSESEASTSSSGS
ncbi:MAG: hypothetical protein HKN01_01560 [Acidimicrobiia bacterium]|nr:hypothetical protein [Acidimicrobiia bacterium]